MNPRRVRDEFIRALERNRGESVLFSAGLDSGIIAALAPDVPAFTISLESYGSDEAYAQRLAAEYGIDWHHRRVTVGEARAAIPEIVRIRRSFDPAIPNDLAAYFGIKLARDHGYGSIMTGDGCDELFAGYDFMREYDLNAYIPAMAERMTFSSNELGDALGIAVKQPYLDRAFLDLALGIDGALKVREDHGAVWGKWIVRKAFESDVPPYIIWREKTPLEYGSGMTALRDILGQESDDGMFAKTQRDSGVTLRSKEHLYYYEVYRDVVGDIPAPADGEKRCPLCGAGVPQQSTHCRTCGAFPV